MSGLFSRFSENEECKEISQTANFVKLGLGKKVRLVGRLKNDLLSSPHFVDSQFQKETAEIARITTFHDTLLNTPLPPMTVQGMFGAHEVSKDTIELGLNNIE